MLTAAIRQFFLPAFTRRYLLRILLLIVTCYLIFNWLLIPLRIQGQSMEPTYRNNSSAFCWRFQYLLSPPKRFDVVVLRYSGKKTMLLKRIIGLPGETIEFRQGKLYVNEMLIPEPYVQYNSRWNLPPRMIKPEHVYVVGDNRGTEISGHHFGQIHKNRIVGGVVL